MSIKKWAIFAIKLVGRLVYVWMPQWVQDRIDESMREFEYLLHKPVELKFSDFLMEQKKPAPKKVVAKKDPMVDDHQKHIEAALEVMKPVPKRTRNPKVTPPQEPVAPIQI